jgi:ABC-type multidrug transport system fused ATPase/permease subunit
VSEADGTEPWHWRSIECGKSLLIAHLLSTVKDCDRPYRLDGGRMKDQGTFSEPGTQRRYLDKTAATQRGVRVQ